MKIVIKIGSSTLTGKAGSALNVEAVEKLVEVVARLKSEGNEVVIVSSGAIAAGLAPIGAGLTQTAAYEELRKERRIALIFKGLSFWDARRWDIIAPDKGRTGCTVLSYTGAVNTNATIVYGYLDYWDVPDNELAYNPAASGSAATKNPKQ